MQYNEIEEKLIRLALNSAAHSGESITAAEKLIKSLRKRGVHADEMISSGNGSSEVNHLQSLYRQSQIIIVNLEKTMKGLRQEIEQLKVSPAPHQRKTRPKYGYRVLSDMEREMVIRFAERSLSLGGLDIARTIFNIHRKPTDYGTLQRLINKGYAERRGRRNYHGLTAKGIEYYRQHCTT